MGHHDDRLSALIKGFEKLHNLLCAVSLYSLPVWSMLRWSGSDEGKVLSYKVVHFIIEG
jgi:hypothetical protein